jgi:hypothetical protein
VSTINPPTYLNITTTVDKLVNVTPTITTINPGLKYIPAHKKSSKVVTTNIKTPKTLSQRTIRVSSPA